MSSPEGQHQPTPTEQPAGPEGGVPENTPTFANQVVEDAMKKLHEDAAARATRALKGMEALYERGIIDEIPPENVVIGAVLKRVHRSHKASSIIAQP